MILSNIFQIMGNKEWIAFANEKKCNHAKSLIKSGFISWVNTANFEVGDIVYLFMSNTRNVRFKTQVVADNCKREDSEYWLEQAPTDITFRLKLVAEYSGDQLNESVLIKYGFKGGRSLQTPSYKNENLMDYIKSIF